MRVIFLDVDGVLNSVRSTVALQVQWPSAEEEKMLDPIAVKLLQQLCKETNAKIVISSTWRQGRTINDFEEIFKYYGWDNFPIIGVTPKMHAVRGVEIANWLQAYNSVTTNEPIESYVILDDSTDMLDSQKTNFVWVSLQDGFSLADYVTAIRILDPNHSCLSPLHLGGYIK